MSWLRSKELANFIIRHDSPTTNPHATPTVSLKDRTIETIPSASSAPKTPSNPS